MMAVESSLVCKVRRSSTEPSSQTSVSDTQIQTHAERADPRIGDINDERTRSDSVPKPISSSSLPVTHDNKHLAAVKLQKVYRSFRTRRQLADCTVLVEQRWWKVLDFAELKRTSISFFDIEKRETPNSRWSRVKKQAAKVGKGLSKDEKAQKLALQHWLEAVDPRHRYGHNLQFYYSKWLQCLSSQPFFYWLDIGEGKDLSLEKCSRSKLLQQCIKYLGPTERFDYEVFIENGKFKYKKNGELLDTSEGPTDVKWIFVLSALKTLYVGQKKKGTFQHSSFLAGGATLSAGRLVVEKGILKAVWPHSGHYLPTEENFHEFILYLKQHQADLSDLQERPQDEEEKQTISKTENSGCIVSTRSEAVLPEESKPTNVENLSQEDEIARPPENNDEEIKNKPISRLSREFQSKITRLKIPEVIDPSIIEMTGARRPSYNKSPYYSSDEDGYETAEEDSLLTEEDFMVPTPNAFDKSEEEEDNEEIIIPEEKIFKRIDSHKGIESYQLAKQLSSKWTTGAGPRISCMRDYPSELQVCVLEQANLSPRPCDKNVGTSPQSLSRFGPRILVQTSSASASHCRDPSLSRFALENVHNQQLTP